jgi:hypothetical protein
VRNKNVNKSLVKIITIFVHSCRDETRLAVFPVPFPQTKFPNVFVPANVRRCDSKGCDFFERRGESVYRRWNTADVPFFLFQMASYVFVLFLCDFFDVSLSASMRVRIWTHRYFFTVIIFSSMVKEYVCRYRITKYLRHK